MLIKKNKKAFHNYEILDSFEAGIVLFGGEVKPILNSNVEFKDSYIKIDENNEVFLINCHVSKPTTIRFEEFEEERNRKLLLNKLEIQKIKRKLETKGLTLVPVSFYTKNGKIKLEICIAKGKKLYDKKKTLKERDLKREFERIF